jgi:hypothetical protein
VYPILEALVRTTLYGIHRMIKREVEEFGRIEATANRDKYRCGQRSRPIAIEGVGRVVPIAEALS